ncbi:hypothetical protein BJ322DRAFT_1021652 [Thelephora terrestris]|uniref:WD40 repeat-like protein n=1 Tax=Thelephora terrestris TaxID=56493 RepID=A0A9P6HCL1_9AGAM|nr:hypothetical protein BJ322DRAFT_1021652 [Thelephora terrestris]
MSSPPRKEYARAGKKRVHTEGSPGDDDGDISMLDVAANTDSVENMTSALKTTEPIGSRLASINVVNAIPSSTVTPQGPASLSAKISEMRTLIQRLSEDNRRLREHNETRIHDFVSRTGRVVLEPDEEWHDHLKMRLIGDLLAAEHESLLKRVATTKNGLNPFLFNTLVQDTNTLSNRLRALTVADALLQFDYIRFSTVPLFDGSLAPQGRSPILMGAEGPLSHIVTLGDIIHGYKAHSSRLQSQPKTTTPASKSKQALVGKESTAGPSRSKQPKTTTPASTSAITTLQFSPDGSYLASGGENGVLSVFSTARWKLVESFRSGDVHTVEFQDHVVRKCNRVWTDINEAPIHCLEHHPKRDLLAVGCGTNVILATHKERRGSSTSWIDTTVLPDPPVFLRLRGSLSKPLPRCRAHSSSGQSQQIIVPRGCQIFSGASSISADQMTLAVTNLLDGVDFYPVMRGHTPSANIQPSGSAKVEILDNVTTSIVCDSRGYFAFGGSNGSLHTAARSPAAVVQTLELESMHVSVLRGGDDGACMEKKSIGQDTNDGHAMSGPLDRYGANGYLASDIH